MTTKTTLTEEQVKIYISKYVIPHGNKTNEAILRSIIFSAVKDWVEVGEIIMEQNPALESKKYIESLDLVSR